MSLFEDRKVTIEKWLDELSKSQRSPLEVLSIAKMTLESLRGEAAGIEEWLAEHEIGLK